MYVANGLFNQTLILCLALSALREGLVNCLYHFHSEIVIKILCIVNWQVSRRVVTGEKQSYKMNNIRAKMNIPNVQIHIRFQIRSF